MQINPSEIDSVEEVGSLNNSPVKIVRLKGGFHIAIGKNRGKALEEALAAGSHPAIVKYNLQKQFRDFRPALMKNEQSQNIAVVEKHTKHLSQELQKSGHDLYSIQNGLNIEFQLTKYDVKAGNAQASIEDGGIVMNKMDLSQEFAHALAGAVADKAVSCKVSKIGIKG